ncbi:MAG: cell division protein SepF [Acholeplasmataceae bacterium]|jgi:cell division inhibitor SepF|nr:cell division protein SepF [Acholeplasmataceae bacterium]
MGLFSVNKKKKEKVVEEKVVSKSDQIVFEKLSSDDDLYLTGLADKLMSGMPLILNFEFLDIDQANKAIAFFSGIVYAIKGEIVNIQEKVFMFATKDVYDDGTMDDFLKEIVE